MKINNQTNIYMANTSLEIKLPNPDSMSMAWDSIKKTVQEVGLSKKIRPYFESRPDKENKKKVYLVVPKEAVQKLCPNIIGQAMGLSGPAW